MKDDLDKNPGFCVAPWLHMHFMPNSDVLPCCVWPYDRPVGNIAEDSVFDIWNNDDYKSIRKQMLSGSLPKNCQNCKDKDSVGGISLRNSLNQHFSHLIDSCKKNTLSDGSINDFKMSYLDVRFSNNCNFRCRGCSPALSSSWFEDFEKLYNFKSDKEKFIQIFPNNRFEKELKQLLPTVDHAYFAGGEPLIMNEHYKILEDLINLDKTNIHISYNSNLSVLKFHQYDVLDFWSRFKNIALNVSIDDYGKRGEYFRKGMSWDKTIGNIYKVKQFCPHVKIRITITVNIMNVSNLCLLHNKLVHLKVIDPADFVFNLLLDPEELSVQVLPLNLKSKVEDSFKKYINVCRVMYPNDYSMIEKSLKAVIDFMTLSDQSHRFDDFIARTKKLDAIRSEDFREIFPEFKDI